MEGLARVGLVGLGGAVGAIARYLVGLAAQGRLDTRFPWATFAINVSGSLAIGLCMGLALATNWSPSWRLFVVVGLLGGYTTYSTFAYETFQLIESRRYGLSLAYFLGTGAAALLALVLGHALANALARGLAQPNR